MSGKIRTANGELDILAGCLKSLLTNTIQRCDLYRSCITCVHFDADKEVCRFRNCNERPPATIIANGCDSYEDINDIPF